MLAYNPQHRPSAQECLEHPYFDDVRKYFEPTFKEGPKKVYKGKD